MFRGMALLVFLLLAIGPAYAGDPVDVLVVKGGPSSADLFSSRLMAELDSIGFSTSSIPSSEAPLDVLGRAHPATAAVRCLSSGKGFEVWLDERANGRPMVRQMVVDERPGEPDVNMVVLQTTELLRAGLRGLTPQTSASAQAPPLLPDVAHAVWAFGTGIGLHDQLGAFPAFSVVRVEGSWTPLSALGIELMLQGPLHSSDLKSPEGTTKARPWTVVAGGRISIASNRFFAQTGVGLQGQFWSLQGDVPAALLGKQKDVFQLGVYSRARAGVLIAKWLRCGLDLLGSANSSETRIEHAQRYVGGIERFGMTGMFVLEVLSL